MQNKAMNLFKISISCVLAVCLAVPVVFLTPATEAAAETTDEKLADAQARLDAVTAEMDAITAEITSVGENVAKVTSQISDVNEQINAKEEELAQKQEQLGSRMASKYRAGDAGILDLILNSTSFADLASNWFYAEKIMEQDNDLINEVKAVKADLDNQKTELENLQSQQEAQLQALQSKQQEMTDLVTSLDSEVQELLEQQEAEKAAELAAMAAIEAEKNAASNGGSSSGSNSSSYTGNLVDQSSDVGTRIVQAAQSTPAAGYYLCATWVTRVYRNAGAPVIPMGNANDMFYNYCHSSDLSTLQPGMLIACGSSSASPIYGHVGIYIGNGLVMNDGVAGPVSLLTQSLDTFIAWNGDITGVRWGFPW